MLPAWLRPFLLLPLLGACGDSDGGALSYQLDDGAFVEACNWDGNCSPDTRWFEHDGGRVGVTLMFATAIGTAPTFETLRANLQAADAYIDDLEVPTDGHEICGQIVPTTTISGYADGRIRGSITGAIRLCDVVEGDILDDTGIDPVPFAIGFELGFDPSMPLND